MAKAANSIYLLEPITDNPVFEGFGTGQLPSLLGRSTIRDDFYPVAGSGWNWTLVPLKTLWQPLRVLGRVVPFNDFPCISLTIPAFSRRAADGLRDMLELNGELLELEYDKGEYFAYNCTRIVEILDREKCKALWGEGPSPMPALAIRRFAVKSERTSGLSIFRMRELCNCVFVTDVFRSRVLELGLNGFEFVKVWPFPEGVDYAMEDAKRRREHGQRVVGPTGLMEVKGQSLIIELSLKDDKISLSEKKAVSRFQDELDAQLVLRSMDEVYYGSLEGRSTRKGKTRLIFSCPDCVALVKKLAPWLNSLEWPQKPIVLLRQGPFDDTAVEEVPFDS
ncbi:MAG: hypothetical protein JNL67_21170 [Planctomycetaceae bacterium]|nr:hypothetical protein [Planctomycetaceae bacterium]